MDRIEMHKNIGDQRNNWNSLLLNSVNMITLTAALMAGIASVNGHGGDSVFHFAMATTNAPTATQQQQQQTPPPPPPPATAIDGLTTDELTTKALNKRYDGLMTVRTKAVKAKGVWYWTHLEPILVRNTDTGFSKAMKLRCSLYDALFSASNPSGTATEHLKRGTCPNFNSVTPISTIIPSPSSSSSSPLAHTSHHHRK